MAYRRSDNNLAYGDDYDSRGGGGRWDRERFERTRARSRGPPPGSEYSRYDERDNYGPPGGWRSFEFDDRRDSRGGRGSRVEERDRYEDDRYSFNRKSRPDFLDEDRYRTGGRELAPYRNKYDEPEPPRRPGYGRRQSSWDAHDRRPIPRYDDDRGGGHEDLKVSVRVGSPPSRGGYEESRYDDRRYDDDSRYRRSEAESRDFEDYRDSRIIRERELQIDRKGPRGDRYDDFDRGPRRPAGTKKGKTRMPKRLVHRRAILDLGYPFEEEDDFYLVRFALGKDHIDECIKISESYFHEEKTTYRYSETRALEAPPPPASVHSHHTSIPPPPDSFHNTHSPPPPAPENEVIETVTTKVIENPTPSEVSRYKHQQAHAGHDHHSSHHGGSHQSDHSDHTIHGSDHGHGHDHGHDHGSKHESFHESFHESSHSTSGHDKDRHGSRSHAPSISIVRASSPDHHGSRARSKSTRRGDIRLEARSKSRAKSRQRSKSRRRSSRLIEFEDETDGHIVESGSVTGPLGLIVPDRTRERERKKERDIKAEIRALEAEKKALRYEREAEDKRRKYERKADRVRRDSSSSSDSGRDRDVVRVEKDRRGRLNLVRSSD